MSADLSNVQWVPSSVRQPGAYRDRAPKWFVGKAVKVAFAGPGGVAEHMWVDVTGVEGGRLVGTLDSKPALVRDVKFGDRVEVTPDQVEDVYA